METAGCHGMLSGESGHPAREQAELDVVAALVGRWEGQTDLRTPAASRTGRVLVVKRLWRDGTQWKADAEYGPSLEGAERVDPKVTVADPTVTLEFVSHHGLQVALKLVKANVLEGVQTSGGGYAFRIRLERTP